MLSNIYVTIVSVKGILPYGLSHLQLDGVTHCAATLRYIELGVRNSDDSEVQIGTRLGALESFAAEERTL